MTKAAPDSNPRPRPRGRPRRVSPQQALDAAVRVFWSEGYEGASIGRLSDRMHLPKSSLYQTYGDKEGLFLATIARYAETRLAPVAQTLTPRASLADDLRGFFDAAVTLATADPETPGCLISCVLADAAGSNARLRQELNARFTALEQRLHDRLVAGQKELNGTGDLGVQAIMLASVARGLMLRARAGADRATLQAVGRATVDMICAPRPT